MLSLGAIRNASNLARNAVDAISNSASLLANTVSNKTSPTSSFADVLASEQAPSQISVSELRNNLTTEIEAVLQRVGIDANPPITLITNADGTIELEGDHERAVEIEANLNETPSVRALSSQLATRGDGADRRLVLHSIGAGLSLG
jgi:hypothetical protein